MKAFLLLLVIGFAFGLTPFIDMWEEIDDVKCIYRNISYICFRVYQSSGKLDPHFPKNIKHIKDANLTDKITVAVYVAPAVTINATQQAEEVKKAIQGLKIAYIWIQVEGSNWGDHHKAQALLKELVSALQKIGPKVGIKTSHRDWMRIVGRSFHEFSSLPLWHVQNDGRPDDRHFRPFGGWRTSTAKQYASNTELCDDTVNRDSLFV